MYAMSQMSALCRNPHAGQDAEAVVVWLRSAAVKGSVPAQAHLALQYYEMRLYPLVCACHGGV